MYLVRNSKFGFAIGFPEISRVNEQNEQVHDENFLGGLKTDLIALFIYDLCYKFWFSRPTSNVLSPAFN